VRYIISFKFIAGVWKGRYFLAKLGFLLVFICVLMYLQCPGRLKLTDQHIIFKNSKTGKVEQITASDLDIVNWQRLVGTWGIRIFLKNGTLHRFGGFKEGVSNLTFIVHI
jgi:hypothetical protein